MPAPFDPRQYEDAVLKPMRKLLPDLPDDLAARYAVDPAMSPAELKDRVEAVAKVWNGLSQRSGTGGLVAKALINEHLALMQGAHDPTSPQFWASWFAGRQQRVGSAIDALATQLREEYGALKVLTVAQLRETAQLCGVHADADVEQARAKAGLTVVEPAEPAAAPPRMHGNMRQLTTALTEAGVRSIPQLLYPTLTSFRLLDRVVVVAPPPVPPDPLSAAAIANAMQELDKRPDTGQLRSIRSAFGLVRTEAESGTDMAALALFHLLQPVREKLAQGVGAVSLVNQLVTMKLDRADAARIVLGLRSGEIRPDVGAEALELLGEGRLIAAQQAATSLPGPEGDEVRAAVARVHAEVAELRAAATEHLRQGHDEQAGDALRAALRRASDLPELAAELAAIPAPRVLETHAVADGIGVRVTWRPAPGHGQDAQFAVTRGPGRTPHAPDDGVLLRLVAGHAVESEPPVGAQLHYGVFARIDRGPWSRAAAATIRIVPPVSDVVVEGGKGVVTGRWHVHPAAAAVEVRRSTGTPGAAEQPLAVDRNRAFRDTAVQDGTGYLYSIVAVYPAPMGAAPLRSAPVVRKGATRLEAKPVPSLVAVPTTGGHRMVRLSWRQRLGSEVVLRCSTRPCPWPYGATVAPADVRRWGTELDGEVTIRGESVTMVVAVPAGRSVIVPFTIGLGEAVRGQDVAVELIDPVRDVRARRFGDDVRVTWTWPDEIAIADVTWAGGQTRITLTQYRDAGGCLLRAAPRVRRVDVEAVVPGLDDEGRAPAVSVEVDERRTPLRYEVSRRGTRLTGGITATVTVTSPTAVAHATLLLVGAPGDVMPLSPTMGDELLRTDITLRAGEPLVLPDVPVPRHLRRPFWLRCFLADPGPFTLIDPAVTQLKVS